MHLLVVVVVVVPARPKGQGISSASRRYQDFHIFTDGMPFQMLDDAAPEEHQDTLKSSYQFAYCFACHHRRRRHKLGKGPGIFIHNPDNDDIHNHKRRRRSYHVRRKRNGKFARFLR